MSDLPPDQPAHFSSSIGTWDEWLGMRLVMMDDASPEGRQVTPAETVVLLLTAPGATGFLDLGMPNIRDGLRRLMDDFEAETAAVSVEWRKVSATPTKVIVSVTAEDGQVHLVMADPEGGDVKGVRMDVAEAVAVAQLLVDTVQGIAGEPDAAD